MFSMAKIVETILPSSMTLSTNLFAQQSQLPGDDSVPT